MFCWVDSVLIRPLITHAVAVITVIAKEFQWPNELYIVCSSLAVVKAEFFSFGFVHSLFPPLGLLLHPYAVSHLLAPQGMRNLGIMVLFA